MNQIQYYEGANVYTVIIASPSELALKSEKKDSIDANPKWFKKKDYYRAISTTKITELFIYTPVFVTFLRLKSYSSDNKQINV